MGALCRTQPRTFRQRFGRPVGGVFLLVLVGLSGCTSRHEDTIAFLRSHETTVATGEYVVHPPDSIAIHAPGASEVDGTVQTVRADGRVVLRLLGEVDVAGMTTETIAEKLEAQLSRYYVDPEVVVEVDRYASQFYYVFGEVSSPGPKRFTGRDTLLAALAKAQPTFLAWRQQIRVTRPSPEDGERKTIIVDLDEMVREGDTTMNILLQPGDVIEVPPTPLAWLGHRVRELLYPMEPALQAYTLPASGIHANTVYRDEFSNSSDGTDDWRERLSR